MPATDIVDGVDVYTIALLTLPAAGMLSAMPAGFT